MEIKIVKKPYGVLPDFMLENWIGIQVPLATEEELEAFGILPMAKEEPSYYFVRLDKAIEALRAAGKNGAANYYQKNLMEQFIGGKYLKFLATKCELVA